MSTMGELNPETVEHQELVACWCLGKPKPCAYHEGYDDGIDIGREWFCG